MRILQVIPSYLPATRYGGPIFSTHGLAKALVARGNEVEVYTTYGGQNAPLPPSRSELDGVIVNYFPPDLVPRLSWAPELGRQLGREIGKFDIVHLQSVFQWPTWAAARHARRYSIPYIVSPRGMLVGELIAKRNRLVKLLWNEVAEKSNLRWAKAIHVTSTREADDLAHLGWKLPPIVTIPNGIDWSDPGGEVSQEVRDITDRQPYALFFGRLSWKKGLDTLLPAFAKTSTGFLIIAGTDDEGLSYTLRKRVAELQLSDRVTILARNITGADKFQLFERARVFVLPSYSENFGNTILEALASGVPAVVTPGVGAGEIVSQAGAGFIVAKDPDALAKPLEELLVNGQQAQQMGCAGQAYVGKSFSWNAIAASMEAAYRRFLPSASNSHAGLTGT
jgi:glycosyltransferase involved in cell wall biosynthesis